MENNKSSGFLESTLDNTGRRFSDAELTNFYNKFEEHEGREIEATERIFKYQDELRETLARMSKTVESNQETINDLKDETRDLVKAWQDAQATVRFTTKLSKLFSWLAGLSVVGWIFVQLASEHVDKVK